MNYTQEIFELPIKVDAYEDSKSELIERRRHTTSVAKNQLRYGFELLREIEKSELPEPIKIGLSVRVKSKIDFYKKLLDCD